MCFHGCACAYTPVCVCTAHVNTCIAKVFFAAMNGVHLNSPCSGGSAADGEQKSRGVKALKVRADDESSVMDEERPSSPPHLHTEKSPSTQLLSNNIPRLSPHLSYCMLAIHLDCSLLASVTISHISVFLPATSDACGLTTAPFKMHFVYGLSLRHSNFMYNLPRLNDKP